MAQKQLYLFCRNHSIDIASRIISSKTFEHDDNRMILYHGSKSGIAGDIQPTSRAECDFGKGFYMGNNPAQPLTLICGENNQKFYTLQVDLSWLKVLNIGINMDWAMLIAYYRREMESAKGSRLYENMLILRMDMILSSVK